MKTHYLYNGIIKTGVNKGPALFEAEKPYPLNVELFFCWGSIVLNKLNFAIKCHAGLTPTTERRKALP